MRPGETTAPWGDLKEPVDNLFQTNGNINRRIAAWKDAISNGDFGFNTDVRDKQLRYDDREWFNEAVTVITRERQPERYEWKDGFATSNWKYFHDAATFHRFTVLHEVLPEYGMICG